VRNRLFCLSWSLALVVLATGVVRAQPRIQVPQSTGQQGSVTGNPLAPVPRLSPQVAQAPSTTLGPPRFDPYATNPNAASQPPSLLSPSANSPSAGASTTPFWQTPSPQSGSIQPNYIQPNYTQPVYPQPQFPQTSAPPNYQVPSPTYAPGAYPQQPPVLFPKPSPGFRLFW